MRNSSLVEWPCAENVPGLKPGTEAADVYGSICGRGALHAGRSMTETAYGQHGRENAGVSSGTWVRIPRTEDPRFPEEGSSALGKSGPKARTKVVVDGQLVHIPVLPVIRTAGTQEGR